MVSDKWLFFINIKFYFFNIQFVIALNSMFNKKKTEYRTLSSRKQFKILVKIGVKI